MFPFSLELLDFFPFFLPIALMNAKCLYFLSCSSRFWWSGPPFLFDEIVPFPSPPKGNIAGVSYPR